MNICLYHKYIGLQGAKELSFQLLILKLCRQWMTPPQRGFFFLNHQKGKQIVNQNKIIWQMIYTSISGKAKHVFQERTKGQESVWRKKDAYCKKGLEKQKRKPKGSDYNSEWLWKKEIKWPWQERPVIIPPLPLRHLYIGFWWGMFGMRLSHSHQSNLNSTKGDEQWWHK